MPSPYPLRTCKECRKEGIRDKVETINGLCFKSAPWHYQIDQKAKYEDRLKKEAARKERYAKKVLASKLQQEKRRSVYIELPSGEKGTLDGKLITPAKKIAKIKPVSDKRAKELREYEKEKAIHFEQFPVCQFPGCGSEEITLHHMGGRLGSMLTDRRFFKSLCWPHHKWAEENPNEAKEMGLSISRLSKAS